ncbi:hypothetical protein ALC57_13045 [Trachymyrmex cornetzi]|uniref:Uncharacterized protein n=1 Tax=Trachymyrmex cornetzi TaxID=471704 RepID=A0A151J007_9HYME|nr:hypothetical protein ALC57_13045 [Trachymyrmex cornetzi]
MVRLNYIVTIIVITLICVLAQELYSDRYDKVDAENILQNNRLRDQYYNCFMGKAPCITADAKFFKETSGKKNNQNSISQLISREHIFSRLSDKFENRNIAVQNFDNRRNSTWPKQRANQRPAAPTARLASLQVCSGKRY